MRLRAAGDLEPAAVVWAEGELPEQPSSSSPVKYIYGIDVGYVPEVLILIVAEQAVFVHIA